MSKIKQRRAMKALAIAQYILDENIRARKSGGFGMVHILNERNRKAKAMAATPAELFRADRPKLDKRRWRRYQRKQGGYVVRVMTGDNELKELNQKVRIDIANSFGVEAKLL